MGRCETIGILITRGRKIARRKLERVITALGRSLIKVSHFPRGAPTDLLVDAFRPLLLHREFYPIKRRWSFHRGWKIRRGRIYSVTERRRSRWSTRWAGPANTVGKKRPFRFGREAAVDTGVNRNGRRHLTIELGRDVNGKTCLLTIRPKFRAIRSRNVAWHSSKFQSGNFAREIVYFPGSGNLHRRRVRSWVYDNAFWLRR